MTKNSQTPCKKLTKYPQNIKLTTFQFLVVFFIKDAAFLLTTESFLLTVGLFDLQLCLGALLLTIEVFFLTIEASLLTMGNASNKHLNGL